MEMDTTVMYWIGFLHILKSSFLSYSFVFLFSFCFHFEQFAEDASGTRQSSTTVRGLGTDVALVSSMVFLAQFILSSSMGSIISAAGSTTAVIVAASVLSFCGSLSASQVMYLDL